MKFNGKDLPSNRKFGFVFCVLFGLFSAYTAYYHPNEYICFVWLILSILVGMATVIEPRVLAPFNYVWMMLGDLMGAVISPLVLGIIFFVLITPVAVVARLLGRDELRLLKRDVNSYWIDRSPPGPQGDSFKNQF